MKGLVGGPLLVGGLGPGPPGPPLNPALCLTSVSNEQTDISIRIVSSLAKQTTVHIILDVFWWHDY